MEKLTYRQAYDKIINAYYKDDIKPMSTEFCFCGTLSPDPDWNYADSEKEKYPYSLKEYRIMEAKLLYGDNKKDPWKWYKKLNEFEDYPGYEDDLFVGMSDALEELKKIHMERGENVDDVPEFTKRSLKLA